MSRSSGQYPAVIRCASGTWSSDAARSLVATWECDDPTDAMRLAASGLLAECQITEAPIDLGLVGSFRGVTDVIERVMPGSGCLVPVDGGYRVELNVSETAGRKRFSHAHEIGHLLVPAYGAGPKHRSDRTTGDYAQKDEEEFLCDVAATELLMPLPVLRSLTAGRDPGVGVLAEIAANFDVSLEAAGVRLAQTAAGGVAVVVWEETLKTSQSREMENQAAFPGMEEFQPQPRLRIRFGATSDDLRHCFFPREKSAGDDCLVCECLDTDEVVCGECDLPTGRGPKRFRTESVRAPYRRGDDVRMRVITVASPA